MFALGMILTLGGILSLSVYSGIKGGSKNGTISCPVAVGLIIGTLVGGSSTIGTAQLAYNYGMSAWWFTLGAGIGCLVLALKFAVPIRQAGQATLVGIIGNEYGDRTRILASAMSAIGTFINIISQIIAATAVIAVVFPAISVPAASVISAVFMVLYVVFGGTKGAGVVGMLKLVLLYATMVMLAGIVLYQVGGPGAFLGMVKELSGEMGMNLFSPFSRGMAKDLGSGLSLVFGVLTTQTYAQAVIRVDSDAAGRRAALISAILIPPIGIGGIMVGLYMRRYFPGIVAKTALTSFVLAYTPPLIAGMILGTLFITVLGTGAGLALGVATIVKRDILDRRKNSSARIIPANTAAQGKTGGNDEAVTKLLIAVTLFLAVCLSMGSLGDVILNFAFMSMGLRGAVVMVPMCCALWFAGRVPPVFANASVILGPLAVLVFNTVIKVPFDALFIGIALDIIIMAIPILRNR